MKMIAASFLLLTFASAIAQSTATNSSANSAQPAALEQLSKEWMDAMLRHDKAKLEDLMAPEYVLHTSDPKRPETPRAVWLDNLFSQLKIASWKQTDISAHVYGVIGVVTSTYGWTGTFHGKAFDSKGHCTDVWRYEARRWRVVSRTCTSKSSKLRWPST